MDKISFTISAAFEGGYNARAETESIFTQADTLEELNINIAEAIACHYDGEPLPGFILDFVG